MKINVTKAPPKMSLEEFADQHGLTMGVYERDEPFLPDARYYANFEHCCLRSDHILIGAYGNGRSIKQAIGNYANLIQGKCLSIYQRTLESRREIQVPFFSKKTRDRHSKPRRKE